MYGTDDPEVLWFFLILSYLKSYWRNNKTLLWQKKMQAWVIRKWHSKHTSYRRWPVCTLTSCFRCPGNRTQKDTVELWNYGNCKRFTFKWRFPKMGVPPNPQFCIGFSIVNHLCMVYPHDHGNPRHWIRTQARIPPWCLCCLPAAQQPIQLWPQQHPGSTRALQRTENYMPRSY